MHSQRCGFHCKSLQEGFLCCAGDKRPAAAVSDIHGDRRSILAHRAQGRGACLQQHQHQVRALSKQVCDNRVQVSGSYRLALRLQA